MALEIERKFLVTNEFVSSLPDSNFKRERIRQAYFSVSKKKQVRIRITDSRCELGIKVLKSKIARNEFEYEIPREEAENIYKSCTKFLEKDRYHINDKDIVDVYPNGLIVFEKEFDSEEEANNFKISDNTFLRKEITGQKEYSNLTLAKQKLTFK